MTFRRAWSGVMHSMRSFSGKREMYPEWLKECGAKRSRAAAALGASLDEKDGSGPCRGLAQGTSLNQVHWWATSMNY